MLFFYQIKTEQFLKLYSILKFPSREYQASQILKIYIARRILQTSLVIPSYKLI